jgi:hypothetical protein
VIFSWERNLLANFHPISWKETCKGFKEQLYDAPPQNLYIKLVSPHHVDRRINVHLISFDFNNTSFGLPETCKKENKY